MVFNLTFNIYLEIFLKYFSLFQTLYFLTLELIISILSIGSCFSEENLFVVVDTTKSCNPSILCDIPLVRGDCVDIPLVRSDCESFVGIPLSEEVIVVVWLSALSL